MHVNQLPYPLRQEPRAQWWTWQAWLLALWGMHHLICIDNDYSKLHHGDALTLFKDITLQNITCHKAQNAFRLQGKPELPLENIRVENVTVEQAENLYSLDEFADDVSFRQVTVNGQPVERTR